MPTSSHSPRCSHNYPFFWKSLRIETLKLPQPLLSFHSRISDPLILLANQVSLYGGCNSYEFFSSSFRWWKLVKYTPSTFAYSSCNCQLCPTSTSLFSFNENITVEIFVSTIENLLNALAFDINVAWKLINFEFSHFSSAIVQRFCSVDYFFWAHFCRSVPLFPNAFKNQNSIPNKNWILFLTPLQLFHPNIIICQGCAVSYPLFKFSQFIDWVSTPSAVNTPWWATSRKRKFPGRKAESGSGSAGVEMPLPNSHRLSISPIHFLLFNLSLQLYKHRYLLQEGYKIIK